MSRAELARQLAVTAGYLERRGYTVGILRQAAVELLEAEKQITALLTGPTPTVRGESPSVCRRCGVPLAPRAKGRPRVWCSDECRRPRRGGGGNAESES